MKKLKNLHFEMSWYFKCKHSFVIIVLYGLCHKININRIDIQIIKFCDGSIMIEEFGKRKMLRESCVQRKYRIRRTLSRSKTRGGGGNYYSFSWTVHTGSGIIIITEKTLG